jgi:bifunctional DNA-binding transcriptional regulator/antitoxin component of YhaV-PrlF toxin-antitoxin module
MGAGSRSKVTKVSDRTRAMKTNIPIGIVEQLNLKDGDYLDWEITFIEGEKVVIVRKVKS